MHRVRSRSRRKSSDRVHSCRLAVESMEARRLLSVNIEFDYTYDTTGFFDDPARRAVLQAAATAVTGAMTDTLTAITPGGSDTVTLAFNDPTSGGATTVVDPTIAADTIRVYVGALNLADGIVANSAVAGFTTSGSIAFRRNLRTRGQPGAATNPQTDFSPIAGTISFDSDAPFHFAADTTDLMPTDNDFISFAEREICHVLGFGNAESFLTQVSGTDFTGPKTAAQYGGPVPLESDVMNFLDGTNVNGVLPVLDPNIDIGTRQTVSQLDLNALDDIGWNFDVVPPPLPVINVAAIDSSAGEPSSNGLIRISRDGDFTDPLNVDFALSGSATRFSDYNLDSPTGTINGTRVTIPAGQNSVDLIVRVRDDSVIENNEVVTLTPVASSTYTIGTSGSVNITDDDLAILAASRQAVTAVDASTSGRPSDLGAFDLKLSANGRYATFVSHSTNLVSSPLTTYFQVYRRDLLTGKNQLVSIDTTGKLEGNNDAFTADISADGQYVAFETTATNVVGGSADKNSALDIYVRDMLTSETFLITRNAVGAVGGRLISISKDGEQVLFSSTTAGSAFVKGLRDTNGGDDLFVFNRRTGRFTCVTVRSDGTQTGNRPTAASSSVAGNVSFSDNGQFVVFPSRASNLVSDTTDGNTFGFDLFVRDLTAKTTEYVAVSDTDASTGANNASGDAEITADGRYVIFRSRATNIVSGITDVNDTQDVFVRDRVAGTTRLLSKNRLALFTSDGGVGVPDITPDGRFAVFTSTADNLVSKDANTISDAFLYNLTDNTLSLLTIDLTNRSGGNAPTIDVKISDDGTRAAFLSFADNLPGDFDKTNQDFVAVYTRDLIHSVNYVASFDRGGNPGSGDSSDVIFSADGTRIGFSSSNANLVKNDVNGNDDLFVAPVFGREPARLDPVTGKLTVLGSPVNDSVNIQQINSTIVVVRDDQRFEYRTSSVTSVDVLVGDGDDLVVLGNNLGVGAYVSAGSGDDTVRGSGGSDRLQGGPGRDVLYGGAGDDRIDGGKNNDVIYGETGDDNLLGGDSDDHMYGGGGRDRLTGDLGSDTLDGGGSNDRFYARDAFTDAILGGDGNDTAVSRDGQDILNSIEAG